jgi:ABC-type multidrug transport system fused ATPase/permease subunit
MNRSIDVHISLQGALIALRRLLEFILIEKESDKGDRIFEMNHALKVEKIKFGWAPNNVLFKCLSLTIPRRKIVSLWGPSGAGKSTLAQLIQRKYEPERGKITIDSECAEKIVLRDYRNNIALVPQEISIFNGTLAENIVLGRPFCLLELQNTLKRYHLEKFFGRFEQGMHTLIGEEYRQLSGGEKQFIGLARALLSSPSLLIVDEAFNALDIECENLFFTVLQHYAYHQAALIITHNIKIILKTDYVYVLDQGKIVQEGKPAEILSKPGLFSEAFKKAWLVSLPPWLNLDNGNRGNNGGKLVQKS